MLRLLLCWGLQAQMDRTVACIRRIEFRKLLLALSPFIGYLFIFKHYQFLRDYSGMSDINPPNMEVLPWLEQSIFQCLPHKVLSQHTSIFLDLMAAIPYLIHFPLPLLFTIYLALQPRRRRQIYPFLWCAGWVNFLAVINQFVFPTAPPWFKDSAIFDENGDLIYSAPNEAGFARLDAYFGMQMFHNIYGASPVKFGAMPSLHVAWPAIILVCRPWVSMRFGIFHLVWITWAALYSNHHYGVDALAGILLTFFVSYCMVHVYCPWRPTSIFLPEDEQRESLPR
eukprot:m.102222 g.102222  ORF g.102222 m.102222 type:complete len:283 (-) comp8992_c0_seq1:159-1007(-)